jgi:ATP synthase protein I
MQDDPFRDRLKRLEERIEGARTKRDGPVRQRRGVDGSALGWRMVIDLVVGMLLGLAIGYGLDAVFGTLPVFLVIFVLLGFGAGVRAMLRSADEMQRRAASRDGTAEAADASVDGGPTGAPKD